LLTTCVDNKILLDLAQTFRGGNLSRHLQYWQKLTSDAKLLSIIKGYRLEFDRKPKQEQPPIPYPLSLEEKQFMQREISTLLQKKVISECSHEEGEFISNVFLTPKKDGSFRMILNLKDLNDDISYHHFKMESFQTAVSLVQPSCWMGSVDFKDAFFSVRVDPESRKYLRFIWNGKLFQFNCLPQGLSSSPRIYSKIAKPLFASLRKRGFHNSSFIDDAFLMGETRDKCQQNINNTVLASISAGYIVNVEKSVLEPCQTLEHLGFIIDSVQMTIFLTSRKASKIQQKCCELIQSDKVTIQFLAEIVGMMVATFPANKYGPLYYRLLDNEKTAALKHSLGNFKSKMILSNESRSDIKWWIDNIYDVSKTIRVPEPDYIFTSDASQQAWGGTYGTLATGGHWNDDEQHYHVNELELLAALYTIQSFSKTLQNCHVRIMVDNSCTVAYIQNMGGRKQRCNAIVHTLWKWCIVRSIWISACHIPGKTNCAADKLSRMEHDNVEWKLEPSMFAIINDLWGPCKIDLFASRLNTQLPVYVSWKHDPASLAVDAFSINWTLGLHYAFPPFSLIGKVLQKAIFEESELVIIVPFWVTQPWFSTLLSMLSDCPFVLSREKNTLTHPRKTFYDGLPKLRLLACRVSGNKLKTSGFRKMLAKSSCLHGDIVQLSSTTYISDNGSHFAVDEVPIHFHPLWKMC